MSTLKVGGMEQYRPGELHARGHAQRMLIRQWYFPDEHEDGETVLQNYSDRIEQDYLSRLFMSRAGGDTNAHLELWFRSTPAWEVLRLLIELLHAQTSVRWTGFRILATVTDQGHVVWTFELFAKRYGSPTITYSEK